MDPEGRVMVVCDVLADLTALERHDLLTDPSLLRLRCQAHVTMRAPELVMRDLFDEDKARLAELAEKALLDRLPAI